MFNVDFLQSHEQEGNLGMLPCQVDEIALRLAIERQKRNQFFASGVQDGAILQD